MIVFPETTSFGRRIPKQKFYQNLKVASEVKRLFIEQIRVITWANKLSAETMNLIPGKFVQEIEVFSIKCTGDVLDRRVLELMDKQIPYHLLFLLKRPDGKMKLSVTYKEASQGGENSFRLRQNYATDWQEPEELSLELTSVNLDTLYESIIRQIAGDALEREKTQSLQEDVEKAQTREKLQKEIHRLSNKMHKEKQLSRQMVLRREIRKLQEKLNATT